MPDEKDIAQDKKASEQNVEKGETIGDRGRTSRTRVAAGQKKRRRKI
jgi:hypothetical protein